MLAACQVVQCACDLPHDILLRGLQRKDAGPPRGGQPLGMQCVVVCKGVWPWWGRVGSTQHRRVNTTLSADAVPTAITPALWSLVPTHRRRLRFHTAFAARIRSNVCTVDAREWTAVHYDVILFFHRRMAGPWPRHHSGAAPLGNRDGNPQGVCCCGGGVQRMCGGGRGGGAGFQREGRVFQHSAVKRAAWWLYFVLCFVLCFVCCA